MNEARRLLDLVIRELGAADARLELFGEPPDDPRVVARDMGRDTRIVAVFSEDVGERREELQRHLDRLVDGFAATAHDAVSELLDGSPLAAATGVEADLAEALDVLRERAGARACVIIDERSPEIWGSSPAVPWRNVDEARAAAPQDAELRAIHDAIETVREGADERTHHVSPLLGLYRLVVVEAASPLQVEGAVRKARPVLERLLRAMPPRQPPPTRAAVVPLRD